MPKVSIIIPCYNQGNFIDKAIKSALDQTFEDIEIIVVNDGSTDHQTNVKLSKLCFPNTRVITTKNQGLAAARNTGIQKAKGEYILPLDADDYIDATYIEIAVKLLDSRPELGIVYCRAQLFGVKNTEWRLPDFSLKKMLLDNIIFCTAAFRKKDWEKVGGYDPKMEYGWEDYDFWLSLIEMGRSVYRIPRVLFYYRVSENSMVRSRALTQKIETFVKIFHKHSKLFSENIGIWVEAFLTAHNSYHEAHLAICDDVKEINRSKWFRKVDVGPCRLAFGLNDISDIFRFCFYPSDGFVAIKGIKIKYETKGKEEISFNEFETNADLVYNEVYIFSTEVPKINIDFNKIADNNSLEKINKLIIKLKYLSFGKKCLPEAIKLHQEALIECKNYSVPDKIKKKVEESDCGEKTQTILGKIKSRIKRKEKNHLLLLKRSGLFDKDYYTKHNPEIDFREIDPILHYIRVGWQDKRNPNELFDISWYKKQNPDCAGMDPLLHFIEKGWRNNRDPNPYFSTAYYLENYPESIKISDNPLAHYLQYGWREGKNPNSNFDSDGYLSQYPDVKIAGMNPLTHYIHDGIEEGRSYLRFFDIDYYIECNPFAKSDPALIYINFGAEEGQWPNRNFDPVFYREHYCQPDSSLLQAFLHYEKVGSVRGYRPWSLFDPKYYADTYPEFIKSHQFPLVHYQKEGIFRGFYPCREIEALEYKPKISILVPVYNTDAMLLKKCIHSVLYQAYPHWELCLVDDGSNVEHIHRLLEEFTKIDKRIKTKILNENKGISEASNVAASMATGDYIGFLDHDDELALNALYEIVCAINNGDPDVIYSDEDLVSAEGRYLDRFFKPGFNYELLLSHNYITHFLVTKQSLFKKVGGFSKNNDGAQDYDLVLKLIEQSENITHIDKPIYYWRAIDSSTSVNHSQKDYADEAGRKAVQSALQRRGIDASVYPGMLKYYYHVERKVESQPVVDVFIISKDENKIGKDRLEKLIKTTTYQKLKIHCLMITGKNRSLIDSLDEIGDDVFIHQFDESLSASQFLNRAVAMTSGVQLVFLSPQIEIVCNNWIELLLGYSQDRKIGAVGGYIDEKKRSDLKISSIPDLNNTTWKYYREFFLMCSRHLNGLQCAQNVLAISTELCMVKRSLFESAGGFNQSKLSNIMYDIDFSLRLRESGFNNVYLPSCEARYIENPLFEVKDDLNKEIQNFQKKWKKLLLKGDPFYNLNKVIDGTNVTRDIWLKWYAGIDSQK